MRADLCVAHGAIEAAGDAVDVGMDNVEDEGGRRGDRDGGEAAVAAVVRRRRVSLPHAGYVVDAYVEDMARGGLAVGGGYGIETVDR